MHQKEMQIVRFSMIVLFSWLMVIYLLLYQIKGDEISQELSSTSVLQQELINSWDQNDLYLEDNINLSWNDIYQTELEQWSWENKSDWINTKTSLFDNISSWVDKTLSSWDLNQIKARKWIKLLSWTNLRYWLVESTEKLWIQYQYALKDQKNIYYVRLGTGKLELNDTIRKLWGNSYTIATEKEILENKLFGDKVIYINIPDYKDKKVVMIIYINQDIWLLQVDYSTYYKSKWYIKNLFIE